MQSAWIWIQQFASGRSFFSTERCPSSNNYDMRTGPAVVVQRGDLVIAGGCGPLENLIRCGFANESFAGESENFTHIGIGFGA